jgi:antirestriction protein ArdC
MPTIEHTSTDQRDVHRRVTDAIINVSWLRVLKADSRAIFTAASKAQQATDWWIERAGEKVLVAGGQHEYGYLPRAARGS